MSTDEVIRLWRDGEQLINLKSYHDALLKFQRAKEMLIKESNSILQKTDVSIINATPKTKIMGTILDRIQKSITKSAEFLSKNPEIALQVKSGSTRSDIKKAYRKAALKYHPDKNTDCDSTNLFTIINAAYESLNNNNANATIGSNANNASDDYFSSKYPSDRSKNQQYHNSYFASSNSNSNNNHSNGSNNNNRYYHEDMDRKRLLRVETITKDVPNMSVSELRRLMETYGISASDCIERDDMINKIFVHFGIPTSTANQPPPQPAASSQQDVKVVNNDKSKYEFSYDPSKTAKNSSISSKVARRPRQSTQNQQQSTDTVGNGNNIANIDSAANKFNLFDKDQVLNKTKEMNKAVNINDLAWNSVFATSDICNGVNEKAKDVNAVDKKVATKQRRDFSMYEPSTKKAVDKANCLSTKPEVDKADQSRESVNDSRNRAQSSRSINRNDSIEAKTSSSSSVAPSKATCSSVESATTAIKKGLHQTESSLSKAKIKATASTKTTAAKKLKKSAIGIADSNDSNSDVDDIDESAGNELTERITKALREIQQAEEEDEDMNSDAGNEYYPSDIYHSESFGLNFCSNNSKNVNRNNCSSKGNNNIKPGFVVTKEKLKLLEEKLFGKRLGTNNSRVTTINQQQQQQSKPFVNCESANAPIENDNSKTNSTNSGKANQKLSAEIDKLHGNKSRMAVSSSSADLEQYDYIPSVYVKHPGYGYSANSGSDSSVNGIDLGSNNVQSTVNLGNAKRSVSVSTSNKSANNSPMKSPVRLVPITPHVVDDVHNMYQTVEQLRQQQQSEAVTMKIAGDSVGLLFQQNRAELDDPYKDYSSEDRAGLLSDVKNNSTNNKNNIKSSFVFDDKNKKMYEMYDDNDSTNGDQQQEEYASRSKDSYDDNFEDADEDEDVEDILIEQKFFNNGYPPSVQQPNVANKQSISVGRTLLDDRDSDDDVYSNNRHPYRSQHDTNIKMKYSDAKTVVHKDTSSDDEIEPYIVLNNATASAKAAAITPSTIPSSLLHTNNIHLGTNILIDDMEEEDDDESVIDRLIVQNFKNVLQPVTGGGISSICSDRIANKSTLVPSTVANIAWNTA